jgi:HAD superfamily hydrolase (TIGR01490 family)
MTDLLDRASIHVFDVDHTLTRHSTGRRFAQAGIASGVFRLRDFWSMPWFYLRYRLGRLRLEDLTREIRALTGLSQHDIEMVAARAWGGWIADDLYPAARDHVAACRARGHRVVLLSTSFEVILRPLARAFMVDETISSVLEFSGDRATGWIVGGPCYAEEKARRLAAYLERENLSAGDCAFYSDSFHDLASFELVGTPVAVHPDAVLRRTAARRGWPVLDW